MIVIKPSTFDKVEFDAERIASYADQARLLVDKGLSDDESIEIDVDETLSTSRVRIKSIEPIRIEVESGALEDYKFPRTLSELDSLVAFSRLFLEVADRRRSDFAAPELDAQLGRAERMAWDVNLYGRVGRLGLRVHMPRFRYDFRNRHGFSDLADRTFDTLWSDSKLTWPEIADLSKRAQDSVNADHF